MHRQEARVHHFQNSTYVRAPWIRLLIYFASHMIWTTNDHSPHTSSHSPRLVSKNTSLALIAARTMAQESCTVWINTRGVVTISHQGHLIIIGRHVAVQPRDENLYLEQAKVKRVNANSGSTMQKYVGDTSGDGHHKGCVRAIISAHQNVGLSSVASINKRTQSMQLFMDM